LQNTGKNGAQAEILSEIAAFRSHSKVGNFAPYFSAKFQDRSGFNKLVDKVEWKLIEMPLPRLQRIGNVNTPFIYSINWDEKIKKSTVNSYQRGKSRDFNNLIYLIPNVGDYFIQLNGLLRPLIQQQWANRVAETNRLDEARLQNFLFSTSRISTIRINQQLTELQNGKCFYCHKPIGTSDKKKPEVDHFIPWSRYPNDMLSNFVIAHNECNAAKKDFLACEEHLENWMLRINDCSTISQLQDIANDNRWELGKDMSENVSRAIYLNLQEGVELWMLNDQFEQLSKKRLVKIYSH
jgi:5-methylcytosine-specific restriction endonuclease McrA